MPICLPKLEAEKIKKAIRNGTLNPATLTKMTSAQRRDFLTNIVGTEFAKEVNLQFEQKILLKNQEKGIVNWAKSITGISREQREATLKKIRDTYAEKKRRLEDPKERESFLNELLSDMYSKKFKTEVTLEEAQKITELAQDLKRATEKRNEDFTWKTKEDALTFGATKVALDNYVGGLKSEANKDFVINPFRIRGFRNQVDAAKNNARISFNFIADNSRAIVASLDNSLWGRQGIKALYRHPKIWARNFGKSFTDITKVLKEGDAGGDAILNATKAEIYSRPNYSRGLYERGKKLDIGTGEEEFPSSLPSKIPALGRLFRASEVAYEAGAMRLRADIADKVYALAEKKGIDLEDKNEVASINKLVNSMTGRGSLGRLEEVGPIVNKVFFSIKFFKANLDTLTLHAFDKDFSEFARKEAAKNLLYSISSIAIILMIANALDDDSVEIDPRSANFGKIRIGNARFDVTGGMASLVILVARIMTGKTKSSVTGLETALNEGFGSLSTMDLFWNFTENKFSPLFSTIKEILNDETFEGEDPTVMSQLLNLTTPIIVETGLDAFKKEKVGTALLVLIADAIGISANTYSYNDNWDNNPGKELIQFKEKIGDERFKEANEEYVELVNKKIEDLKTNKKYQAKDNEDKKNQLSSEKRKIKDKIFKKNKFRYKRKK